MYKSDVEAVDAFVEKYKLLRAEIAKVIIGQDKVVQDVLIAIFSKGHGLLVGVPGLAKTLLVNTISKVLDLSYNRIQFTPDLMPSDIIGTEILDETRHFRFIKGSVFSNIILADEINVAGERYKLDEPFFVLATQNPIEQEGTYPLPEAQLDRFMFNIWLDYPSFEEEIDVVKNTTTEHTPEPKVVIKSDEIIFFQNLIRRIPVPDNVFEYAVKLVAKTRPGANGAHSWANDYLTWGAGPRASQYLIIGAKCNAAVHGKYSPDIEDVKAVATTVLRHRIIRNYKAEAEGIQVEDIINEFLNK